MMGMQSVVTPQAPIRTEADHSASLATEALFGETVTIDQFENGFAHVALTTDGYTGWMPSKCLGKMPTATHQVIAPHSFVTATADVKSQGVSHLSLGARLYLRQPRDLGTTASVAEIDFAGASGFVPRAHIMPLTVCCDDWVSVAESFIGSPYRWGGRASTGLDCSALVQLALGTAGKSVPRDSGPQHDIGEGLHAVEDLQRGDLVFWEGHVGIMQDRERLLHANAHHMAVVSELLTNANSRIEIVAGPITALRRP